MKAFLMYPDRDFYLGQELPPNEAGLAADLELDIVLRAMAAGDQFLFGVARQGLHSGITDPEEIAYRQHVLADCIAQPAAVRSLYDVAVEAFNADKKILGWVFRDSPESIVHRARQLIQLYVEAFRQLRTIADTHGADFGSEGFTRLFATLSKELGDDYLAEIEAHIGELEFRHGTLISATLGKGNKGTGYTVRRQPEQSWRDRIPGMNKNRSGYSFYIAERDETGARTLSDLESRGLNGAANALAQSTDHIRSFFEMLRAELGFYLGCLNLRDRLLARGHPVCLPEPAGPPPPSAADARLTARGLYDASLALSLDETAQAVVFWMHDEHGPDAKILTVPARDPRYDSTRDLADVPEHLRAEIGHFFDIYKALEPGKGTDVRGWQDRAAAEQVIGDAFTRARHYESDGTSPAR
jgi:Inorganic pyrophosphatase